VHNVEEFIFLNNAGLKAMFRYKIDLTDVACVVGELLDLNVYLLIKM
jgi:hypothetical protein